MLWSRSRLEKPSEKHSRRQSILGSTLLTPPLGLNDQTSDSQPKQSIQSTRSADIRDSVVSLNAVDDVPVFDPAGSPPMQEKMPKHRRFSILKFRHASDSQLSKTAREQREEQAPPLPSCMLAAL